MMVAGPRSGLTGPPSSAMWPAPLQENGLPRLSVTDARDAEDGVERNNGARRRFRYRIRTESGFEAEVAARTPTDR